MRHLELDGCVSFLGSSDRPSLARWLHESHAAVVPLAPVDRSTRQGCCRLKMLEAMSAGCRVIASDLPVVRELAEPYIHFLTARPGGAKSLKDAIVRLASNPALDPTLARQALEHVRANNRSRRV